MDGLLQSSLFHYYLIPISTTVKGVTLAHASDALELYRTHAGYKMLVSFKFSYNSSDRVDEVFLFNCWQDCVPLLCIVLFCMTLASLSLLYGK